MGCWAPRGSAPSPGCQGAVPAAPRRGSGWVPSAPNLRGRQLGGDAPVDGGGEELLPQDVPELLGQHLLLLHAAVVLQGQDHWVRGGLGSKVPPTLSRAAAAWGDRGKAAPTEPPCRPPAPPRPYLEGVLAQGAHHLPEGDLGGEGVAVVHHGLPVGPVPAVHLQAAAAPFQSPAGGQSARHQTKPCPPSAGGVPPAQPEDEGGWQTALGAISPLPHAQGQLSAQGASPPAAFSPRGAARGTVPGVPGILGREQPVT